MPHKIAFADFPARTPFLENLYNTCTRYFTDTYDFEEVEVDENPDFLVCSYYRLERLEAWEKAVTLLYCPENTTVDGAARRFSFYQQMEHIDYAFGSLFEIPEFAPEGTPYHFVPYGAIHYDVPTLWKQRKITPDTAHLRPFCSFLASNSSLGNGAEYRQYMFNWLTSYKKVTAGGQALNNIGGIVPHQYMIPWLSMFKFNICFENSSAPGYITEKPLQSFFAGTIPIYWGHKETMQMLFNPDALIYVDSYEEAYNRVVELDNNPEMYKEMLLREPLRIDLDSTDSPFNLHGLHRFFDTVVTESFPEIHRRSSP